MINFNTHVPVIILNIPHNYGRDEMISAVRNAFDLGCDAVRVGVLPADGSCYIVSSEWVDSRSINANESPLSLDELLNMFPEGNFNLLLVEKDVTHAESYVDTLQRCNAVDRVLTSTLYTKMAKAVRNLMPGAAMAYPFVDVVGLYALYRSGLMTFKRKFDYKIVQTYESIGPSYLASQGFVRILKTRGVGVHIIVEEKDEIVRRLLNVGVSGFIIKKTDFLHRLREIIRLS